MKKSMNNVYNLFNHINFELTIFSINSLIFFISLLKSYDISKLISVISIPLQLGNILLNN